MNEISVRVADVRQIAEGRAKIIFFDQKEVAIFNCNGEFYALENLCPHQKGPLSAGTLEGGAIVCPWHGARFELKTGKGLPGPHRCDARSYAVRVEGFDLRIVKPM
jgi:nitrite reductase/ring-hydroxylating ferredoxin subunit